MLDEIGITIADRLETARPGTKTAFAAAAPTKATSYVTEVSEGGSRSNASLATATISAAAPPETDDTDSIDPAFLARLDALKRIPHN